MSGIGRARPAAARRVDSHENRLDPRSGHEHVRTDSTHHLGARPVVHLHRRDAVGVVTSCGGEALAGFALHHDQHVASIFGTSSSRSSTRGVAMLYGRLATSVQIGSPANSRSQSSRVASPSTTRTPCGSTVAAKQRHEMSVDLDRGHRRTGLGQAQGSANRGPHRSRPRDRPGRPRPDARCDEPCWGRPRSSDRERDSAADLVHRAPR